MEINPQTSTHSTPLRIAQGRLIKNRTGVIDVIAHDAKTDTAVLVMNEAHTWDGSDAQLHELQERLNTYASFLLDGEFAETHPELAKKQARVEVRCTSMPDARSIELLGLVHDQLAFQDIQLEVVVRDFDCHPASGSRIGGAPISHSE